MINDNQWSNRSLSKASWGYNRGSGQLCWGRPVSGKDFLGESTSAALFSFRNMIICLAASVVIWAGFPLGYPFPTGSLDNRRFTFSRDDFLSWLCFEGHLGLICIYYLSPNLCASPPVFLMSSSGCYPNHPNQKFRGHPISHSPNIVYKCCSPSCINCASVTALVSLLVPQLKQQHWPSPVWPLAWSPACLPLTFFKKSSVHSAVPSF